MLGSSTHLARSPLVLHRGLEKEDYKPTQPIAPPGLRPPARQRLLAEAQGTTQRIGFLAFEPWEERNTVQRDFTLVQVLKNLHIHKHLSH